MNFHIWTILYCGDRFNLFPWFCNAEEVFACRSAVDTVGNVFLDYGNQDI